MEDLIVGKVGNHEVLIPKDSLVASKEIATTLARLLGLKEIESSLCAYWSLNIRKNQWQTIFSLLSSDNPQTLSYLEIGSGLGMFTAVGNMLGLNCIGIEPSEGNYQESIKISHRVLSSNGLSTELIKPGKGEQLEFPNRFFDVVISFQTLEHVNNPLKMLSECYRVLKPGGLLFIQCPNYLYPYEGHYGTILPLFLGKKISRFALYLYRRPTKFNDLLNYITPSKLRKYLTMVGFNDICICRKANGSEYIEINIDPYLIPFRFTRGIISQHALGKILSLPLIRNLCESLEITPEITCIARKAYG